MTPLSRSQGFTDRLLRSHRTSRDPLHRGAWGPEAVRQAHRSPSLFPTTPHPVSVPGVLHSFSRLSPPSPHATPNPLGSDSSYCTIPSFLLASSRGKD